MVVVVIREMCDLIFGRGEKGRLMEESEGKDVVMMREEAGRLRSPKARQSSELVLCST